MSRCAAGLSKTAFWGSTAAPLLFGAPRAEYPCARSQSDGAFGRRYKAGDEDVAGCAWRRTPQSESNS